MERFSTDANGAGLGAIVTTFLDEGDFGIKVEFIEAAIEDGVAMKIHPASIGCFEKPIVFEWEQF
jgi:hypothetical protein